MVWIYLLGSTVALGAGFGALWLRRRLRRWDGEAVRELEELGLDDFNRSLMDEVAAHRRPHDHLAVTHRMAIILRAVQEMPLPTPEQIPMIDPQTPLDHMACEELANLGRLNRTRHPNVYVPVAPPRALAQA